MEYKHFSHTHGLNFLHQVSQESDIICSGCNFPVITGSVYSCSHCTFFLHDHCFNATRSVNHPSHPSHPLSLFPYPTYPSNSFYCNSCNLVGTGLSYGCSHCEFDLHVHCANPPKSNMRDPTLPVPDETPIFYPQHHAHAQVPQPTIYHDPIPTSNIYDPSPYYPNLFDHVVPHETPTSVAHEHVHWPHEANPIPHEPKGFSPPQEPQPSYIPQTNPNPNQPTTFIPQQQASSKTGNAQTQSILKHFSHSHPLHLSKVSNKDYITCSACEQEIKVNSSLYSCKKSECNFHLHKKCFESKPEILHPSHPKHPLILLSSSSYKKKNDEDNNKEYTCDACLETGTTFRYHCYTCNFDLHVTCASLPQSVERKDHKHPLVLTYESPITEEMREEDPNVSLSCDVCKRGVNERCWIYRCAECDYGTHLSCVNDAEVSLDEALAQAISDNQASMQRNQIITDMARQNAVFMSNLFGGFHY